MSAYIQKLIEEGEHQQLDFKYQVTDAKKIARSVAAFANTDGGRLLIGVKDNGRIVGIRSDEEFYMMESAAEMYCKPAVSIDAKTWNIRGKQVLEVIIPVQSDAGPVTAPDPDGVYRAYVRKDDMNLIADQILHTVWKRIHTGEGAYFLYSENEKAVLKSLENEEVCRIEELSEITGLSQDVLTNLLINLVLADIIRLTPGIKGSEFSLINNENQ
ncbi:MAG TPA: ATP-binding protein [Bacteroidales bacterium]|nr:ATP-binding protein [Bacteroidales bacterium]